MKTERLEDLIQKHVLGQLTEAEAEEFSQHLQQEDAAESRES